ncbi:MAG: preprotein translocase subunit YajC [Bacteroidota bacterium]
MKFLSVFLMMQSDQEGALPWWAFPLMIVFIFYFMIIRPQQKKTKQAKEFREALKKGTKVVTIGGIHGKVESIKEKTAIITTEGGGKLKVDKSAISIDGSSNEMAMGQKS